MPEEKEIGAREYTGTMRTVYCIVGDLKGSISSEVEKRGRMGSFKRFQKRGDRFVKVFYNWPDENQVHKPPR